MNRSTSTFVRVIPILLLFLGFQGSRGVYAQVQGWCEEKYLVQESNRDKRVSNPSLAVAGDHVYLVYRQQGIYFMQSGDRGKTWSAPQMLSKDQPVCGAPAVAAFDSKLVVVWPALIKIETFTAFQLFFVENTPGSDTWSAPRRLNDSRDHVINPRFLNLGDQALLVWFETPLAETLGGISTMKGSNISVESVEQLFDTRIMQGSLADQRQRVRSKFYASSYTPRSGTFSPPASIDEIFAQSFPHLYTVYGPIGGKVYLAANENTDIRCYESADQGRNWKKTFDEVPYFDSRMMLDLLVIDGKRYATWMTRDPYQQIPVNFFTDSIKKTIQLSPPHFVRSLPRLVSSQGDFHAVWEAGNQDQSRLVYMRSDKVPPNSTIVNPTSPEVLERKTAFGWTGNDNISSTDRLMYSYSYKEGTWSQPQAETVAVIDTPPDGEYTFRVRAEDVAGNIQTPESQFAFNTYRSAPDTLISSPPDPNQELNTRTVTLAFTGEDNTDPPARLTFSAQVDDGPWTDFTSGSSYAFANLSNGEHILRLKTRDTRGNVDPTPASCRVRIKVGMELVLDETPPLNTNAETLSFRWTTKDDKGQPVTLKCLYRLNGGDAKEIPPGNTFNLTGLEEGRYEITLWGVDPSGDQTPEVKYQWVVDLTPPNTMAAFTKEYRNGMPLIQLSAEDPEIQGGVQSVTPRKYEYKISDGEWTALDHPGGNWPVPHVLSMISWGYVVTIRAIDAAGNADLSPLAIDLRLFSRTEPWILYTVAAVLGIILVLVIRALVLRSGRVRRPMAASPAAGTHAYTSSFDEEPSGTKPESSSSSTFKFDDDEDPYA